MSYVSTDIKKIIAEIIENKKEKGGVKNIYFVGCGGSLGALYPANVIVAGWIACSSNYFIPASGQCVAALAFDSAGTTKIGKFVLNHSYMIPGLVCTVVSVVVALLIGAVVF